MPYLLLDSFITFCLSGIEASEVEVSILAAAVTELGFDCVGSVLPVCVGLPFVYILTSVL